MKHKKLLLHICCAPCSTHVLETLKNEYQASGYFYNPNLYPEDEHTKRLQEAEKFFRKQKIDFYYEQEYQKKDWRKFIAGLEQEPEGGARCHKCYFFRLEQTAKKAQSLGFDVFTTTLTLSPYKKAEIINPIGEAIAAKYDLVFLSADFKKHDGFACSLKLSKQHNLYRQNYCGCEFSLR